MPSRWCRPQNRRWSRRWVAGPSRTICSGLGAAQGEGHVASVPKKVGADALLFESFRVLWSCREARIMGKLCVQLFVQPHQLSPTQSQAAPTRIRRTSTCDRNDCKGVALRLYSLLVWRPGEQGLVARGLTRARAPRRGPGGALHLSSGGVHHTLDEIVSCITVRSKSFVFLAYFT
jgi:hypothetical protein